MTCDAWLDVRGRRVAWRDAMSCDEHVSWDDDMSLQGDMSCNDGMSYTEDVPWRDDVSCQDDTWHETVDCQGRRTCHGRCKGGDRMLAPGMAACRDLMTCHDKMRSR